MSATWNGSSLRTEYGTMLGDTKSSFLTKVLGWMNDIQDEIAAAHSWGWLRKKGKKILTASAEEHDLFITPPGAPTVAAAAGGSLTADTAYYVAITYVESVSGAESKRGTASAAVTPTGANLTINVTAIPTSTSTLVTSRKVYLKKGSAAWYLYATISDNTTTTQSITADTTDTTEAPDRNEIMRLDGRPFFESASQLTYKSLSQLRFLFQGSWATGTPSYYSDAWQDRIILYPVPSSALTISFYYFRYPHKIYNSVDSQPELPQSMRRVLRQGVKALGYEYRERKDWEAESTKFYAMLAAAISDMGTANGGIPSTVNDTQGDSDGWEVD